ncbi:MAG TPA: DUF2007 domain-containing protein [Solirubrobacterales bacterium]|nr:DUF2007 domain-containing protein [Solirubrobacterales bacterium]
MKVAFAQNETEAEMIQGILRDQGIPSMTRKPEGSFMTDLFAMGSRDIIVPAAAEEKAIEILDSHRRDPDDTDDLPGS